MSGWGEEEEEEEEAEGQQESFFSSLSGKERERERARGGGPWDGEHNVTRVQAHTLSGKHTLTRTGVCDTPSDTHTHTHTAAAGLTHRSELHK